MKNADGPAGDKVKYEHAVEVIGMIPMLDSHDPYHDPLIAL